MRELYKSERRNTYTHSYTQYTKKGHGEPWRVHTRTPSLNEKVSSGRVLKTVFYDDFAWAVRSNRSKILSNFWLVSSGNPWVSLLYGGSTSGWNTPGSSSECHTFRHQASHQFRKNVNDCEDSDQEYGNVQKKRKDLFPYMLLP